MYKTYSVRCLDPLFVVIKYTVEFIYMVTVGWTKKKNRLGAESEPQCPCSSLSFNIQ